MLYFVAKIATQRTDDVTPKHQACVFHVANLEKSLRYVDVINGCADDLWRDHFANSGFLQDPLLLSRTAKLCEAILLRLS